MNQLYDETNLQEKTGFTPVISSLGEPIEITFYIRRKDYAPNSVLLFMSSPNKLINYEEYSFSWSKLAEEDIEKSPLVKVSFTIEEVKKCGFYDWSLLMLNFNLDLRITNTTS